MTQKYSRVADCHSATQRILFLSPKISLLCSQKSVTKSYHEPIESSLYSCTFSWMHFVLTFRTNSASKFENLYDILLHVGVLSERCYCLPESQAGWKPWWGLRLLIQYILSYTPYQDAVSICNLKKRLVVGTRDPLRVVLPSSRHINIPSFHSKLNEISFVLASLTLSVQVSFSNP
jgi:hypothetical protein